MADAAGAVAGQAGLRVEAPATGLRAFLDRAPKAEVHIHLEGAVGPACLEESAVRHGLAWAGRAAAELARRRTFHSLAGFFGLYRWVLEEHLRTPEDYVAALRDVARSLADQNVRYAELSVSAGALLFFRRPLAEILDALGDAAAQVQRAGGPELRFIADGVRQHGPEPLGRVLELLLPLPRDRWPALGLAGDETSLPARAFAAVFAAARAGGLRADIHSGEGGGPGEVWQVLEHLRPDRLVHALAAAGDPVLVQHLRARRTPLALNPTSNLRTGVVPSRAGHPLRRFLRAGLVVSVNTDDPALFGTSLARELELAAAAFRLGQSALEGLVLGGLECAFLPEARRTALLEAWGAELERLRDELGLEGRVLGEPRRFPAP